MILNTLFFRTNYQLLKISHNHDENQGGAVLTYEELITLGGILI